MNRSLSISLIRLIALLLIIACHMMQWGEYELAWWFNVGVQIFLCISGFLYGQKETGEITNYYFRRFKKILIPYYIVFISYGMVQFFFARDVFNMSNFIKGLFVNATLTGAGHLWFVSTILLCYVLTPLLGAFRDKYALNKMGFCLFTITSLVIATLFFIGFDNYYNPAWICSYVVGYALGINEKKDFIKWQHLLALLCVFSIIGYGIQIYCVYIEKIVFRGCLYFYDYNHMFLGVFMFALMKLIFDLINLEKIKRLLIITDDYSYEAYLVHHLIILGPFSLMALTSFTLINVLIILAGTCIMAWFLKRIVVILNYYFSLINEKRWIIKE